MLRRKRYRRRHALGGADAFLLARMLCMATAVAVLVRLPYVAAAGESQRDPCHGAWSVERLGVVLRTWAEPAILDGDGDVSISLQVANRSSAEAVRFWRNRPSGYAFRATVVKNEETGEFPPLFGRGRIWCNPVRRQSAVAHQFFDGRRMVTFSPADVPFRSEGLRLRENFAIREPGLYSVAVSVWLRGTVRSAIVRVPPVHFRVTSVLPEIDTESMSSQRDAFFDAIATQTTEGVHWAAEVGSFPAEIEKELGGGEWQRLGTGVECKAAIQSVEHPWDITDLRVFYVLRNSSAETFAVEYGGEPAFRLWDIRWIAPSGKKVDYSRDVRTYWRRREDIDWWFDPLPPHEEKRFALRLVGPWREIGDYKLFVGRRVFRSGNVNLNVRPEATPEPETIGCWLTFRNEKVLDQKEE